MVCSVKIFPAHPDGSDSEPSDCSKHDYRLEEHDEGEGDVDGPHRVDSHSVAYKDAVHNGEEEDAHHAEYGWESVAYELSGLVFHAWSVYPY